MKRALSSVLVCSTLGLAACGDDDAPERSGAAAEVATAAETFSEDATKLCALTGAALEKRLWKNAAGCRKAQKASEDLLDGKPATQVDVEDVQVDGSSATARVAGTSPAFEVPVDDGDPIGVPEHAIAGTLTLGREKDRWVVTRMDSAYIRPTVALTITATVFSISGVEDPDVAAVKDTADCVEQRFAALADDEEQELLYDLASGDESAEASYVRASEYVGTCLGSPDAQA